MWIAAMSGGGFGIHQCPCVSDVLKSWGMGECRRATPWESDSSKQQVSTGDVPDKFRRNQMFASPRNVQVPHVVVVHQIQN